MQHGTQLMKLLSLTFSLSMPLLPVMVVTSNKRHSLPQLLLLTWSKWRDVQRPQRPVGTNGIWYVLFFVLGYNANCFIYSFDASSVWFRESRPNQDGHGVTRLGHLSLWTWSMHGPTLLRFTKKLSPSRTRIGFICTRCRSWCQPLSKAPMSTSPHRAYLGWISLGMRLRRTRQKRTWQRRTQNCPAQLMLWHCTQ